jgi:hypothetical protein
MSEVMTVESILDAYWQTQNHFTKPRFFYTTGNNGNSDIDVLAYDATNNSLVLVESKAHGGKSVLKHGEINSKTLNKVKKGEVNYDGKKTDDDFLKFCADIKYLIKNHTEKKFPFVFSKLKKITIHFVSTVTYKKDEQVIKDLENHMEGFIKDNCKLSDIKIEFIIETHFDVIIKIIQALKKENRGKRYGHPVLDILREFNRYLGIQSENDEKPVIKNSKSQKEKPGTVDSMIADNRKIFLELLK